MERSRLNFQMMAIFVVAGILLTILDHFCGGYARGEEREGKKIILYSPAKIVELITEVKHKKITAGRDENGDPFLCHRLTLDPITGIKYITYVDDLKEGIGLSRKDMLDIHLRSCDMDITNFTLFFLSERGGFEVYTRMVQRGLLSMEEMKEDEKRSAKELFAYLINLSGSILSILIIEEEAAELERERSQKELLLKKNSGI